MKSTITNYVKNKLSGYKVCYYKASQDMPEKLTTAKSVAVIGAGIAGISAACQLAERGFEVVLYEKNNYLGGKLGSWQFDSNGNILRTTHGFHAFFRQYHNLKAFMHKMNIHQHLIPIDDYMIYYKDGFKQGFKGIDNTPVLNIMALRKKGIFGFSTYLNPYSAYLLALLRYHPEYTFSDYDYISFEEFALKSKLPSRMTLVFNSFARAFFAEPNNMSMAELIKGFHFYFLSNDDGLIYDVLNDDFQYTFLQPCADYILHNGGKILLNTQVHTIAYHNDKFVINDSTYDYCILASDIKHTKQVIGESHDIHHATTLMHQLTHSNTSGRYAVLRIWTDTFTTDRNIPFFVFTDRIQCLDSITFYHLMEEESKQWSQQHNGGIYELHCYALPNHLKDDYTIRKQLLEELCYYFPELQDATIVHEYMQHRDDFPSFGIGQHQYRPEIVTPIKNLYLSGDWVKMPFPCMLMEAAYSSATIAVNHICEQENVKGTDLFSVAPYGLLRSAKSTVS